MIRVAEHVARTDTGRQRATNEDAHLSAPPSLPHLDGLSRSLAALRRGRCFILAPRCAGPRDHARVDAI